AMANPTIRQIAGEPEFIGDGGGINADPSWTTQPYFWTTRNRLIIPGNDFFYRNATGLKTGFTDQAGFCLAATAERDGRRLIAMVMNAPVEYNRWRDSRTLLEFGFNNFADEVLLTRGDILYEVEVDGARLGEDNTLQLAAAEHVVRLLSRAELGRIEREITLAPERLSSDSGDSDEERIAAPVNMREPLAVIRLTVDGETIYEGNLIATSAIEARSFGTDMSYRMNNFIEWTFSLAALPFWIGLVLAILGTIRLVSEIRRWRHKQWMQRLKTGKNPYKFSNRAKYTVKKR
ncbi:MAG: hypothetical protein FWE68_01535, partial [Defluviitaleaceae bacterium]|nr:hypothetical protein [Defluviitaleaceae bacterium]